MSIIESAGSQRATYVGMDAVYGRSESAREEESFVLSKEDSEGEVSLPSKSKKGDLSSRLGSRATEESSIVLKSRNTEDDELEEYEEFEFEGNGQMDDKVTQEEEKNDGVIRPSVHKKKSIRATVAKSSMMSTGSRSAGSSTNANTSAITAPGFDEFRVRMMLRDFLQVHEPKAIKDGRLDALVKWTETRGVSKLRIALQEQFSGADLLDPHDRQAQVEKHQSSTSQATNRSRIQKLTRPLAFLFGR